MKTIGLIGGTSWHSTIDYYRLINQLTNQKQGGSSSARIILYSVKFDEFRPLAVAGEWQRITEMFSEIAQKLETAGAECLALCANTPHIIAPQIQEKISIPLIHIADETGKEIKKGNYRKVGLLGTNYVMQQPFYKERLSRFGIETVIPEEPDFSIVHDSIVNELTNGIFKPETKVEYLKIVDRLHKRGAEGVILGCTEIPMLIKKEECPLPSFDTTLIHARAIVEYALG